MDDLLLHAWAEAGSVNAQGPIDRPPQTSVGKLTSTSLPVQTMSCAHRLVARPHRSSGPEAPPARAPPAAPPRGVDPGRGVPGRRLCDGPHRQVAPGGDRL